MKTTTIDGVEYILTPKEKEAKWRLPTVSELVNMYDYEKGKSRIDGFNISSYWSSTTKEGNSIYAWEVYFGSGGVYFSEKDTNYYVRCVRDTDDGLVWSKSSEEPMPWDEAVEYAKNLKE